MQGGHGLETLDYLVFGTYLACLLWMSYRLGQGQESEDDYYVGGRDLPWWAVGISTAATQTSAIGFMSIPAFIALKPEGGLKLLQSELGLPLALGFVMLFFLPLFRQLELISAYEYLELRFGPAVRYLVAGVFLVSRGVGTAVGLYMTALVFSAVFGWSLALTIVVVGGVTVVYDTMGGMKAVVYSDVLQLGVLLFGAGLVIHYAVGEAGGFGAAVSAVAAAHPERLGVVDFTKHGLGDGGEFAFWPQLVGGFFLQASYYGCDQTQTQRELSTPTLDDTCRSLVFNAFFRFPLALLYAAIGVALAGYVLAQPGFAEGVLSEYGKADYLLPVFILQEVPAGARGLIFVAVLAAAMSSLDSALNSLSASTVRDFLDPLWVEPKPEEERPDALRLSKLVTVLWGAALTALAFFVGDISPTVIEAIQKVGSAASGPIMGAFFAGVALSGVTPAGMFLGVVAGVLGNVGLWLFVPGVFWMWWNATGFLVTVGVAFVAGRGDEAARERAAPYVLWGSEALESQRRWVGTHAALVVWTLALLGICLALPGWLGVAALQ